MLWGDWSAQDVGDVVSRTLEPLLLAPSLCAAPRLAQRKGFQQRACFLKITVMAFIYGGRFSWKWIRIQNIKVTAVSVLMYEYPLCGSVGYEYLFYPFLSRLRK